MSNLCALLSVDVDSLNQESIKSAVYRKYRNNKYIRFCLNKADLVLVRVRHVCYVLKSNYGHYFFQELNYDYALKLLDTYNSVFDLNIKEVMVPGIGKRFMLRTDWRETFGGYRPYTPVGAH